MPATIVFTEPNILQVDNSGQYIKVGDWILQYDPNASPKTFRSQMVAKVTAKEAVAMGHPLHTDYYNLTLDTATI